MRYLGGQGTGRKLILWSVAPCMRTLAPSDRERITNRFSSANIGGIVNTILHRIGGARAVLATAPSGHAMGPLVSALKTSGNTEPGIIYMLAGATLRSDTDPYDTTSP